MNFFNNFPQFNQPLYPQKPQINPALFQQAISTLDEQTLRGLVQQARNQGISEQQIKEGLEQLANMRKNSSPQGVI